MSLLSQASQGSQSELTKDPMRKYFYFVISIIYWLFMVIGFADNWLYDTNQESNFIPKFLVHAFFAFSWFSLLVVQTGFIRKNNLKTHKQVGIIGMIIFYGMIISTGYLYITRFLELGYLSPLTQMVLSQFIFAIVLITIGFVRRKSDAQTHKNNITFGCFMLMFPAIDRAIGHVFDDLYPYVLLSTYFILFGSFVWHAKKIKWQFVVGFIIWLAGIINMVMNEGI